MIDCYCFEEHIYGEKNRKGMAGLVVKKLTMSEENFAIVRKSLKVPFILPMKEG